MVATSKRAEARPRSASSPLVASAMNPSTEGTLAAVEAPSRMCVRPNSDRLPTNIGSATTRAPTWISAVRAVRTTAIRPKTGPTCMTR